MFSSRLSEPNLAQLKTSLKGRAHKLPGHVQDSFSLTVAAVAQLLGREADYETVYALSTNAFAPGIIPGDELCRASWHMVYRERCLDLPARRIGLRVRQLALPEEPSVSPRDPAFDAEVAKHLRACAPLICGAMADGEIVVTNAGWPDGPSSFYWWWGIITEAGEDGAIRGATVNGKTDNPITYIHEYWAFGPQESSLTAHEADVEMLRRAVSRIRGDRDPFLPGHVVFGLAAMACWIEQMVDPAGWDSIPPSENAWATANPTYEGAKVVSSYLRRRMDTFPEGAQSHLMAAASHYDRIVALLHPAITGDSGPHYRDFIGNLENQKAHADNVLVPIKAELSAAADEMEKALAAME